MKWDEFCVIPFLLAVFFFFLFLFFSELSPREENKTHFKGMETFPARRVVKP